MTVVAASTPAPLVGAGVAEWPRNWDGHWIGPVDPVPSRYWVVGGLAQEHPFSRHLYRRTFELAEVPDYAPMRLTADSRYVLHINGVEVGRGPVRSQPRRMHFDDYDIAPFLAKGENSIVVLVTYYGSATSSWAPVPEVGNFGRVGVLVAELRLPGGVIGTDSAWQVQPQTAWSQLPRDGIEGLPVEVRDARELDPLWTFGTAGHWKPAILQPVVHFGGMSRSMPPTDPFGPLQPRPIAQLDGEDRHPVAAYLSPAGPPVDALASPVVTVRELSADQLASSARVVPADALAWNDDSSSTRAILLDFGRIVTGLVSFELTAPRGTRVDMHYLESPHALNGEDADGGAGARYIARGHDDAFRALEINGLRYVRALVTTPTAGEVRLGGFRVAETLAHRRGEAFFRSSDPELDRLYTAGIRTVELNSLDAYIDCPTREQRAWVGDGVVHQMVTLTTSEDWRLARRYVELGNAPRNDGILPMSVGGDAESGPVLTIPDWSLYWIHGVHNLYRYTADVSIVADAAATAKRILSWFLPYVQDGVLADVPEWTLVDWASLFLGGKTSILTGMWARALDEFAEISDYLGNAGDASWARNLHAQVKTGFEQFWDEARGTYVDHVVDGEPQAPASQHAGAFAVIGGLVPKDRVARVIAWISNPARQVTRSWIGANGGYDEEKSAAYGRGDLRIDWDAENETVVAQPFASFAVHDAYAAAGRPDLIVTAIRRWSEFLDDFDTFGECWGWGTPVHGWSSTPTRDIVQRIVGVMPDEPGFTRARIAPAFGLVHEFEAAVPTPFGLIRVRVHGDDVRVESPVPYTLMTADGATMHMDATAAG